MVPNLFKTVSKILSQNRFKFCYKIDSNLFPKSIANLFKIGFKIDQNSVQNWCQNRSKIGPELGSKSLQNWFQNRSKIHPEWDPYKRHFGGSIKWGPLERNPCFCKPIFTLNGKRVQIRQVNAHASIWLSKDAYCMRSQHAYRARLYTAYTLRTWLTEIAS